MDEEVLDMIDLLADEIFSIIEGQPFPDKKKLKDLLENRFIWVINYTHNLDALLTDRDI